jgi:hypothetical protein
MFANAVDAGLVLQAFVTAARGLGLGSADQRGAQPVEAQRLLELPAGVFRWRACVRYRARRAGSACGRRVTVHVDRYDDATCAAGGLAAGAGAPRHAQESRRWSGASAAEPYGWSEDKARQFRARAPQLGPHIRRHGFGLA